MAKSSAYQYTNVTDATVSLTPKALNLPANYALNADNAEQAILINKTTPVDALERITFQSRDIKTVGSGLNIQYPSPVQKGVQYQVKVEETLVTTDTSDANFRVDEPIVATLTIRHNKSGNISNALVGEAVVRLISACRRADGSWRFDDLMRGAERPVEA